MVDLVLQLHAKFTVQLESRMKDTEATMYCTVFLPSENEIVTEMQGPGGDYNDMVTNHQGTEKRAHLVLQRNAKRHRGDSWRQGKPEPLGSKEGGGPWAREITEEGKFSVLGD